MTIEISWAAGGVVLAVTAHALTIIRIAAKLEAKVEMIATSLSKMDKELERRDTQLTALWKRMDEIRDMIKQ